MICVWLGEMHRLYSEAPVVNMKTPRSLIPMAGMVSPGLYFSYTLRGCRCVVSDLNERPYACAYAVYFFKFGSCEFGLPTVPMQSKSCSLLLQPIITDVTRVSRSTHARAISARVCPRCRAILSSMRSCSTTSELMLEVLSEKLIAARESARMPPR